MREEWEVERVRRGKSPRPLFELPQDDEMGDEESSARFEIYDALHETPSIWPQNRQCLLHIVEYLKKALPVKEVHLDPCLLSEPSSL